MFMVYGIFASQGTVMEWVDQKENHGPFILTHGDFRPPNIFVDDDLTIIAVVDWEWSHTIPAQMFLPPSWLGGQELPSAIRSPVDLVLAAQVSRFQRVAREREDKHHNPDRILKLCLPLTRLWSKHAIFDKIFIPYALSKPCYFGDVYCNLLDKKYYGKDREKRVHAFFELPLRKREEEELQRVLSGLEAYKKELTLVGLEPTQPDMPQVLDSTEEKDSNILPKKSEEPPESQTWKRPSLKFTCGFFCCWLPCSMVGVSVVICCIIAKRTR